MNQQISPWVLVCVIAVVILAIILVNFFSNLFRRRKLRRLLAQSYGQPRSVVDDSGSLDCIAAYWRHERKNAVFAIDDTTWSDLDMNRLFSKLNHTCCSVGEEYLYSVLRLPDLKGERLCLWEEIVRYFETHEKERAQTRFFLARLGKSTDNGVVDFFHDLQERVLPYAPLYPVLSVLAACGIISLIVLHAIGLPFFLGITVLNMVVYYKLHAGVEAQLRSVDYIQAMAGCGQHLAATNMTGFPSAAETWKADIKPLARMGKLTQFLLPSGMSGEANSIWEYIRMYFLLDFVAYGRLVTHIRRHREAYLSVYNGIGRMDAAIAIASYRQSVPYFTTPVFSTEHAFVMERMVHPLLENPIANSVTLAKSALITGSNASGKSTFVKALAINAILAQTVHTCLAGRLQMPYSFVVTSMAVRDDLEAGESYYIAEIRSLKRVLDGLKTGVHTLCLIDEILKGTNTVERIAASASILHDLTAHDCMALVATHDIELTEMLSPLYDNFHFTEEITDERIQFSYKIHQGRATTKNAIRLLHFMGYDEDIIQEAENLAKNFEKTRSWSKLVP
ncbi:MAG: hypothetical protein ABF449_08275 [Ethanoligenens sp.]